MYSQLRPSILSIPIVDNIYVLSPAPPYWSFIVNKRPVTVEAAGNIITLLGAVRVSIDTKLTVLGKLMRVNDIILLYKSNT